MPKAIALIAGSSLGPEALSAARQAFDNAWAEIAGKFIDVAEKEVARLRLATAILSVATNEDRDVETLKQAGLQAVASTPASWPVGAKFRLARDERYWRNKAAETRRLAQAETHPLIKNELLDIAYGYERVAKLAREQTQPRDPTSTQT
jgi:hypothetical protein